MFFMVAGLACDDQLTPRGVALTKLEVILTAFARMV
jgi:hypothetical protein